MPIKLGTHLAGAECGSLVAARNWSSGRAVYSPCEKKQLSTGKGQTSNRSSTDGVTANFMSFDRGTFWGTPVLQISCTLAEGLFGVLPLTYFYLPKMPGCAFFPNLSTFITFAAAPLVLTPFVCNPKTTTEHVEQEFTTSYFD